MSLKSAFEEHLSNNPIKNHFESVSFKQQLQNSSLPSSHLTLKNHWNSHRAYVQRNFHLQSEFQNNLLENVSADGKTIFRKFTAIDLDGSAELYKTVFSDQPWCDDWESLKQVRTYLNELISNPVFEGFVIQEGPDILAVCMGRKRSWWAGKEFFVDEFFVSKDKQGNGVGTNLMDFVTQYLINDGYTRLMLLTNKEIPAETFYQKNGFYNNTERTVMVREL